MERYKINEMTKNRFLLVPKNLFYVRKYDLLSNDSRMLYAYLLDMIELVYNKNWVNENKEIYLIVEPGNLMAWLHVNKKTLAIMFKELVDVDLIEVEEKNKIYINHIENLEIGKLE